MFKIKVIGDPYLWIYGKRDKNSKEGGATFEEVQPTARGGGQIKGKGGAQLWVRPWGWRSQKRPVRAKPNDHMCTCASEEFV